MSDRDVQRLSNGQLFCRSSFDSFAQAETDFLERFVAQGHILATDDDGEVDLFYTNGGFCNGPGCSVCGDAVCMHCSPHYQPDACPGAEAVAEERRERRLAEYVKLRAEFEPASVTGTGTAKTAQPAEGEACQNGPQGDAQ